MRIGSQFAAGGSTALSALYQAASELGRFSIQLSTLRRINRGSDDPAGLIAAGRIQSELSALKAASSNAARASGMIRVADSALAEVGDLIGTIRGHVIEAAGGGLSEAEIAAKQLEINAALESIDRIGQGTSFLGRKLLDGGTLTFLFSPDVGQTATLQMPYVSTGALGGAAGTLSDLAEGGPASLASGDAARAAAILDAAQEQVLFARAEAGVFEKYTVQSSQRVAADTEVALSRALSEVLDADVASAVSGLVRSELLFDTAILALRVTAQRRSMAAELLRAR